MYAAAPINEIFRPTLEISEGEVVIEMELDRKFHHAGGAAHGSVYFKMLDDAAYLAAISFEKEFMLLTASFTTYMMRPVSCGKLRAVGKVVNKTRSQYIAEAVVYDAEGREAGRGNGIFVRSKTRLVDADGYDF